MGTTGQAEHSTIGMAQHSFALPALLPTHTEPGRVDALSCPSLEHPPVIPLPIYQSSNLSHLSVLFAIPLRSQSL